MKNILIIGNGIAGVTAARHIRKFSDHKITIISSETDYFFSRTALMYIYMDPRYRPSACRQTGLQRVATTKKNEPVQKRPSCKGVGFFWFVGHCYETYNAATFLFFLFSGLFQVRYF